MAEDTKKNTQKSKQSSKAAVKTAVEKKPVSKTTAKKVASKKTSSKPTTTKTQANSAAVTKKTVSKQSKPLDQSQKKEPRMSVKEEKIKTSPPSTPEATVAATPAAPVVVKSGGSGVGLVALLCSLGALGLSGYMYIKSMQNKTEGNVAAVVGVAETKKDIERLDGSVSEIKNNVQSLSAGVNKLQSGDSQYVTLSTFDSALDKAVSSKIKPLLSQQAEVSSQLSSLSSKVVTDDKTYEIAKSRQWLESAQYQIEHQSNVDKGIKLLTLAGQEIRDLGIPAMANTRAKVLAYVDQLQAIETPDLVAVSNKLDTLSKDIGNWPLQNEPKAEIIEKEVATTEVAKKSFLGEVKSLAKEVIDESFKVQKISSKPKVLLAPQERYFLDQNLRLKLQSSQLAMLQSKQDIFAQELNSAKDWIIEYFDEDDARVSDAVEDLKALSSIQLQPKLPDISDAINAFDKVANSNKPQVKSASKAVAPTVAPAASPAAPTVIPTLTPKTGEQ